MLRVFIIIEKTFSKICIRLLKVRLKNKIANDLFNGVFSYVFFFFLIFVMRAYVVGTHFNCIDKSMQFILAPSTYAFTKK